MAALSSIRDTLEDILNIQLGDGYIDSTNQLRHINEGYREAAYRYNWPELYLRRGDVITANVDRYTLQSNFRKFDYLYSRGVLMQPTDLGAVRLNQYRYAVDKNSSQYILSDRPTTSSTAYTCSNSETAGTSVVVELDTVSGLSAGDEIYIVSTTPQFTIIESVDSTNTTITITFSNNISSSNKIYLAKEINSFGFFRTITDLSDAADTPILPSVAHTIIPYYAAYLYRMDKLEEEDAKKYLEFFDRRLADAFLSHAQTSTGPVGEFSIA